MTIVFSAALKNNRAIAIRDKIDSGVGSAKMQIWTGTCPADMPLDPTTLGHTRLGSVTLATAASSVSAGILHLITEGMTAGTAVASGTAAWARIVSDDNFAVMDLSIGLMNSTDPIKMSDTAIVIDTPINIASFYITEG